MAMTDAQAADAIRAHHSEMQTELRSRVDRLLDTVRTERPYADAHRAVLDYLEGELLPHARAEEGALYPAGDVGAAALLVRSMRDEHVNLVAHVTQLRAASDAVSAAGLAAATLALFESHLHKENDLLVPALVGDPNVSIAELLAGMHELIG
jgi:iron-sulfur cluster repair protein YtfE (RIC family)